ncbi:MAG: hypothetical protein JWQ90_297 [Hydrocarboniphaga sp.]|nr:hypothetical protein [Hydrocarboniphaga sp.]
MVPGLLRPNSRLIVEAERPSNRPIALMLEPCNSVLAIIIRSSG